MKRTLLTIIVASFISLAIASPAWGVACGSGPFYVSSLGNDTNNGTSVASPWQHHPWDANRTANANCTLAPGNIVYVAPDSVWWDTTITTAQAGTAAERILTIKDTVAGADPIISGSVDTTGYNSGWTDDGGGVWHRTFTAAAAPGSVSYDGVMLVKDADTTPTANKWFWDANVLYVNVGGDPASTTKWRVSKATYVLRITTDYVTFKELVFEMSNWGNNIYSAGNTGVILEDITSRLTSGTGIYGTFNNSAIIDPVIYQIRATTGEGGVGITTIAPNTLSITGADISQVKGGIENTGACAGTNIASTNYIHDTWTSSLGSSFAIKQVAGCSGWNLHQNIMRRIGDTNGASVLALIIGSHSNTASENIIEDVRHTCIDVNNANSNVLTKNDLSKCGYRDAGGTGWLYYGGGGEGYGIRVRGSSENNDTNRNKVDRAYQGIVNGTTSGAGNNRFSYDIVTNSIVNGIGNAADSAAVGALPIIFYNETVYHNPAAANNPAYRGHAAYMQNSTAGAGNAIFANNLIYVAQVGTNTEGMDIVKDGVNGYIASLKLDYNLIDGVPGANLANITGTMYTTGAAYRAAVQAYHASVTGLDGTQANAESHSIFSDPLFVDAANGDFSLRADSPATNSGKFIAGFHDGLGATDYDGTPINGEPPIGALDWHGKFF